MHVMNLSMTYSMLPDISVGRDPVRPTYHFPVAKQKNAASMESTNLGQQSRNVYKYYVLDHSDDRVYTRTKIMETLYHKSRGSLVDVYA